MSAQNDASFMRMFIFILGLLVAFTVAILFVANSMTAGSTAQQAGDKRLKAEIAERIAPIGSVVTFNPNAAPAAARDGATVVKIACASCHASGALGAPKIGDKADWGGRMGASGLDGLVTAAINGKGAMPPRGGMLPLPAIADLTKPSKPDAPMRPPQADLSPIFGAPNAPDA